MASEYVVLQDQEIREKGNHLRIRLGSTMYALVLNGIEYWFRKEDGGYDGWGHGVDPSEGIPPELGGGDDGE